MSEAQKSPGRGLPPGTPRWLKLFVIIFIAIVIVFVTLHLMGFGFGGHGFGSHRRILVPGSWLAGNVAGQL